MPARPHVHREVREVEIAEHLWSAFDELAACMATDRASLINQAMFVFARLNGFLDLPSHSDGRRAPGPFVPRAADVSEQGQPDEREAEERAARVLRVADQLQRQLNAEGGLGAPDDGPSIEVEPPAPEPGPEPAEASEVAGLYVQLEEGESERVSKPKFFIGRGKTCDLVIDSAKVSRQHAVIVQEGAHHFIEDLKSANGTWFGGRRLTARRKIESGDEYSICNVKVRVVVIP